MRYDELSKLVDLSKPVEVYKNLHKGLWSIRQSGKVVAHSDYVFLKDAKFVVRPGGRARVLREKRKNVHAFVKGYVANPAIASKVSENDWKDVYYNPYKHDSFVSDSKAVNHAKFVDMFINELLERPVIATDVE